MGVETDDSGNLVWYWPMTVPDMKCMWHALRRGDYPEHLEQFAEALHKTLRYGNPKDYEYGKDDWLHVGNWRRAKRRIEAGKLLFCTDRRRAYAAKLLIAIDKYQQTGKPPTSRESFTTRANRTHPRHRQRSRSHYGGDQGRDGER